MTYRLSEKGRLWRQTDRLLKARDRHGWEFVRRWMLLEPASVKRNTTRRRRKWRH